MKMSERLHGRHVVPETVTQGKGKKKGLSKKYVILQGQVQVVAPDPCWCQLG